MAFTVKVDADAILVLKINLTYPGFMLLTIYSLFKKNTQIRLCSTPQQKCDRKLVVFFLWHPLGGA